PDSNRAGRRRSIFSSAARSSVEGRLFRNTAREKARYQGGQSCVARGRARPLPQAHRTVARWRDVRFAALGFNGSRACLLSEEGRARPGTEVLSREARARECGVGFVAEEIREGADRHYRGYGARARVAARLRRYQGVRGR